MGEHKRNPNVIRFKESFVPKTRFFAGKKRKEALPKGRYLIKNPWPVLYLCEGCLDGIVVRGSKKLGPCPYCGGVFRPFDDVFGEDGDDSDEDDESIGFGLEEACLRK